MKEGGYLKVEKLEDKDRKYCKLEELSFKGTNIPSVWDLWLERHGFRNELNSLRVKYQKYR